MNHYARIVVLLAASALGVAACSKPSAPNDSLPQPVDAAESSAPSAAAKPGVGVGSTALADFTVEPGQVFACEGRDRTTSTVKWAVKDPAVATVKVLVGEQGGSERKTFAAGANVGEAVTGDWVVAGASFELVDGKDDRVLAQYEVPPALPCN
jgi:hypothetical protein